MTNEISSEAGQWPLSWLCYSVWYQISNARC